MCIIGLYPAKSDFTILFVYLSIFHLFIYLSFNFLYLLVRSSTGMM